ncbi:MAG: lysophospholipid acyltransferase family protein [Chloroflexi bacterium]|nr:lysophospholipid acyltransferase family protein [Chloroflexota bacterium]
MIRYWLFRLACVWWGWLPPKVGYALADIVGWGTYRLWHRGRRFSRISMAQALGPGAAARDIDRLAGRAMRNYCKYLVDFMRLPSQHLAHLERQVRFDGLEHLYQARESKRGVIIVGLHLGNWDMAGAMAAHIHQPITVIGDTLSPRELGQWVGRTRAGLGMRIIPKEKGARPVLEALRRGEALCLLIDGPNAREGVEVSFLGAPVLVPAGVASLALRTQAPVLTAAVARRPDNTFHGLIQPPVQFRTSGDPRQDARALTQALMASLESLVRQFPDQWYVFHQMWLDTPCSNTSPLSSPA